MRKHSIIDAHADADMSERMETRKRKPLSDITNAQNLIPTSSLRKLVSASSGTKHPVSILKSNSRTNGNKSHTNNGSSIVNATAHCGTVQFQTPSRGGLGSKDAANNLRQTNEKPKKERNDALGIVSPIADVKWKDKGKAIAVSPHSSSPRILKESGPAIYPCTYSNTEREKKLEETWKSVVEYSGGSCAIKYGRKKETGKEFVTPSFLIEDPPFHARIGKKNGKAVVQPSDVFEITDEEFNNAAANARSPRTRNEKRKNAAGTFSCPPVLRTKDILKDHDEAEDIKASKSWTDPRPKCKMKSCPRAKSSFDLPREFIEQQLAYFKEVDEFELPVVEVDESESD